jgi:hypothetical protein
MSLVVIKLVDSDKLREFYGAEDTVAMAKEFLAQGLYDEVANFFFNETGETAAEEAFDFTNNPSRQYERNKYYGRGRSVSVGDIVEVDGVNFLCSSFGWKELA